MWNYEINNAKRLLRTCVDLHSCSHASVQNNKKKILWHPPQFFTLSKNRWLCFRRLPRPQVDGRREKSRAHVRGGFPVCIVYRTPRPPRREALIRLESSSMATWRPPCLPPSFSHAPILRHSNRSHPACCNLPLFQRVKRLVIVQGMSRWQADPSADGIRALTSRRPICPL